MGAHSKTNANRRAIAAADVDHQPRFPGHVPAPHSSARYGTHVGRVGALALALGIGAAITTGHGLGLGVAYADDNPDTTQNDTDPDNNDDGGSTPAPASVDDTTQGGSTKPKSPLSRIADVPKMIFNATGGAKTSTAGSTPKPLPKLRTVLDDIATAVKDTAPDRTPAPQREATQGDSNAGSRAYTPAGKMPGNANPPAITSIPTKVIDHFTSSPTPQAGPPHAPQNPLAHLLGAMKPETGSGPSFVGQEHVAQATVTEDRPPLGGLAVLPGSHTSVINTVLAVAVAPFFTPNPAAPQDPPVLLGVLAWARREIQRTFCNTTPRAVDDNVSTNEDVVKQGNVLTNDVDPDLHDVKTVTNPGKYVGENGTLVLKADGSYTYTPNLNANGQDTFTYTVSDETSPWHVHGLASFLPGNDHTDTGTLTIKITPVNDAPVAAEDSAITTDEDTEFNGTLPAGSDIDGDTLTYTIENGDGPAHGTLELNEETRQYTYKPDANYNGSDAFTYTVHDGKGGTDTATTSITVKPINDAPVAAEDSAITTDEDTEFNGTLPAGSDIDGDTLTYTIENGDGPAHGTLELNEETRQYTYKPDANYNGSDAFTYTVHDGKGGTDTATTSITVKPVDEDTVIHDVGQGPLNVAVVGNRLYVTNSDGTVSVIDTTNNTIVDTDPLTDGYQPITINNGYSAYGVAAIGNRVYVASDDGRVTVIDTTTNTVVDTDPATDGSQPITVGVTPRAVITTGGHVYVANEISGTVSVIDPVTNTVVDADTSSPTIDSIPVGSDPFAMAANGDKLYVGNFNDGTVSVIDTSNNTVTDTISGGGMTHPHGLAVAGDLLYVANDYTGTVSVIDLTTNTAIDVDPNTSGEQAISVGTGRVTGMAASGNRVYVADTDGSRVVVIDADTNTVIGTIPTENYPWGLTLDGNRLYVASYGGESISAIDVSQYNSVV